MNPFTISGQRWPTKEIKPVQGAFCWWGLVHSGGICLEAVHRITKPSFLHLNKVGIFKWPSGTKIRCPFGLDIPLTLTLCIWIPQKGSHGWTDGQRSRGKIVSPLAPPSGHLGCAKYRLGTKTPFSLFSELRALFEISSIKKEPANQVTSL